MTKQSYSYSMRCFRQRSAAELREAAAKLIEREARDGTGLDTYLRKLATRIRRLPLAGFIGPRKP